MNKGFTLVELLISIVLVLMLMIGINQVFTMTSKAVGTGQAMSSITRDNRAAQATMFNDLRVAVPPAGLNRSNGDAPFLMISSMREPAFRNRADELSDLDYTTEPDVDLAIRSRDLDADNDDQTTAAEMPGVGLHDYRNHRVDRVGFFARDLFRRQTGNNGVFVSDMSATEAFIWYGHLNRPDNAAVARGLGTDIRSGGAALTYATNPNNFYATQWILGRVVMLLREPDSGGVIQDNGGVNQNYFTASTSANDIAPLRYNAPATDGALLHTSRYDLAGTSFSGYQAILDDYIAGGNALEYWELLTAFRFEGHPYPLKPFDSPGLARTVPVFLSGCTQFIVEFAGDFLTQNASGVATADVPDGVVDFVLSGTLPNQVRSTRWYGFPRDTTGDGQIINDPNSPDVLPVYDLRTAGNFLFERTGVTAAADYSTGLGSTDAYICVWGPDTTAEPVPSMIRLTVGIDDPNGRIDDAQIYEYVFNLP